MKDFNDFKVKDITLADFGRQEILLAQDEMPAMMQLREKYRVEQPLAGAKIMGCIHMTIQTAVLIETLIYLERSEVVIMQYLFNTRSCCRSYCSKWYSCFA